MKMTAENAETIRINGYTTFVVGFDDKTVELFAAAFNAAFADKIPSNIYDMVAFVGNATEDTNVAVEEGYLTEADRIPEIISLINQFGKFDDDNSEHEAADVDVSIECSEKKFEKTLDKAANAAMMGTWKAASIPSNQRSFTMFKITTAAFVAYVKNGKVMIAKCRKTGRFISPAVVQSFVDNIKAAYASIAKQCSTKASMFVAGLIEDECFEVYRHIEKGANVKTNPLVFF